jgi:WD40 repeat protein
MTFSSNGKRIASGSRSETKIWDAQTGQELLTFDQDRNVDSVAFTPDGHRLISATGGSVKIRDATPLPETP